MNLPPGTVGPGPSVRTRILERSPPRAIQNPKSKIQNRILLDWYVPLAPQPPWCADRQQLFELLTSDFRLLTCRSRLAPAVPPPCVFSRFTFHLARRRAHRAQPRRRGKDPQTRPAIGPVSHSPTDSPAA